MSLITPAGKLGFDWVPKSLTDKNVKTASDMHYDAIKQAGLIPGVASSEEECSKCCEKCNSSPCKCDKAGKESCGAVCKDDEKVVLDVETDPSLDGDIGGNFDGGIDIEVEDVGDEAVEQTAIEQATAKIEEAVEEIKGAVGVSTDLDEIEVDLGEGTGDDSSVDISFDEPEVKDITLDIGEGSAASEGSASASIEKESKGKKFPTSASPSSSSPASASGASGASPASASPASASAASREASVEDEFVKYAKISPSNRKKLVEYWKNDLGFPPEYVKLMTTDFEK